MRKNLLILLYILVFTFVSLFVYQLPALIRKEDLFQDKEEIILCILAGIASGLIVGFFTTDNNNITKKK